MTFLFHTKRKPCSYTLPLFTHPAATPELVVRVGILKILVPFQARTRTYGGHQVPVVYVQGLAFFTFVVFTK